MNYLKQLNEIMALKLIYKINFIFYVIFDENFSSKVINAECDENIFLIENIENTPILATYLSQLCLSYDIFHIFTLNQLRFRSYTQ